MRSSLIYIILVSLLFALGSCSSTNTDTGTGTGTSTTDDATGTTSGTTSGTSPGFEKELINEFIDLPKFPIPVPQPSAVEILPKAYFSNCKVLSDVNYKLINALNKCGYSGMSYYYVKNGFALVTQLEQINPDGTPKEDALRWAPLLLNSGEFSLTNYIKGLFYAKPGYYRCIVFIISDINYKITGVSPTKEQSDSWLVNGLIKLPKKIGEMNLNENYSFDALIYEYKKLENDNTATIIIPSIIGGRNHLEKTKILLALK